jgi:hypothetical protein
VPPKRPDVRFHPQGYPVRFIAYMDYWQMKHKDAGFWGRLWERIKNFFGAGDEGGKRQPSAAIIDSQPVKTTERGPARLRCGQ